MEENTMNTEIVNEDDVTKTENSGIGTGVAMLVGGALALGVAAGVKAIKTKLAKRKQAKNAYVDVDPDNRFDEDNCDSEIEEICEEER